MSNEWNANVPACIAVAKNAKFCDEEVPPRVDYSLTASGERLMPIIDALSDWWENDLKAYPQRRA